MIEKPPIELQRPGAGLPFWEGVLGRFVLMPRGSRRTSWDQSVQYFLKEGEKIQALIAPLSMEQMEKPVLIDRLPGLEDSSRFWSVAMTIEHLLIVGEQVAEAIVQLSHGHVPPVEVDTAKVKPASRLTGRQAGEAFRNFVTVVSNRVMGEVGDRASRARLTHPWFGKMTAHQWNWLLSVHQRLHRKQIERIIQGL